MYIIKRLEEFNHWLSGIKDNTVRLKLARRLDKAARGLMGDIEPVGEGVCEMREHFGSGWRMYYVVHDNELVIMLGGGAKSSHRKDIKVAKLRAKQLED
ncbi:MAG: type II toxin-antitoxin system RelE/ParE family toxin [Colwellia sp.]|nr:type II toxin-antitoxin system RelE/ParE family toxin [Colwellia sp.]